ALTRSGQAAAMADEHPPKDGCRALLWLRVAAAEAHQPAGAVLAGRQRAEVRAHAAHAAAGLELPPLPGGRVAQRSGAVMVDVDRPDGLSVLLDQRRGV